MIMPRGSLLLMPASTGFIFASLAISFLLNVVWGQATGTSGLWAPDWLLLSLTFWNIYQPRKIGVISAFFLGLLMDVHASALLGQHALAYTLTAYIAISIHRRILWFSAWQQALQMFFLFLAAFGIQWLIRGLHGDHVLFISEWFSPLSTTLIWPFARGLLLAPQRRTPDPDDIRPL